MRPEIIARRIAEKVGRPEVEQLILTRGSPSAEHCWPWSGRALTSGIAHKFSGDTIIPYQVQPMGLMQHGGKQVLVHRFLFDWFFQPRDPFRMFNACGNTLCVNPTHWAIVVHQTDEVMEPPSSLEWTPEDVEEILEMYFMNNSHVDPEHPLLVDIPPDLLLEVLTSMNKDHMLR